MIRKVKKLFVIIVILGVWCSRSTAFAHEMYYDSDGNAVVLRWGNLQNGLPYLKINGDYLDPPYDTLFNSAVQAWQNASSCVTTIAWVFNTSTVDMVTPTEEYWEERVGWIYVNSVAGFTDNKDSNGLFIDSLSDAQASTGIIVYSQIYMSPYPQNFDDDIHREKTMVHELGHVLCLGHSDAEYDPIANDVPSIMKRGSLGYKTPQTHDCSDLANKY